MLILIVFTLVNSCNIVKHNETKMNETDAYVLKINKNKRLEETFIEGVLTDVSGNIDQGYFKYNTFYDYKTKELYRIKHTETTKHTVTENFYFNNKKLVFITTKTENDLPKKIYIHKGKVLNNKKNHSQYEVDLLNKAGLFQNEFNKAD